MSVRAFCVDSCRAQPGAAVEHNLALGWLHAVLALFMTGFWRPGIMDMHGCRFLRRSSILTGRVMTSWSWSSAGLLRA